MKTLLLMRHAKSSWKTPDIADHERPLNKRGRRDAPMMGEFLVERELIPQYILSSSALRARQTAEILAETTEMKGEIAYLERLYMAEVDEYLSVLHDLSDDLERVMVIGHNPGLETLLQILSDRVESLPTAVVAHLVLAIDTWAQVNGDTRGELVEIWRPSEVREELEEDQKEQEKAKVAEKEKAKSKKKDKEKEKEKSKSKKKGK